MNPQLPPAIALHRAGRLAEAQTIYRQVLAQNPNDPDALHLLGLVACQGNQLEAAIDLISRALAMTPDHVEYLTNLGEVQRRLQRFPESIKSLERAVALAPQTTAAHYNLAVALTAGGQSERAIAAYRSALALQGAFPEALNNLGLLLIQAGESASAADCFRKALALRPEHVEVECNLGMALWNLGQHAQALEALTRVTQLKPHFVPAHTNLGVALRNLGRRTEAVAAFQRAVQLNPTAPNVHRELAHALLDVNQPDAAVVAARRAVELAPTQAQAQHTLGIILGFVARTKPPLIPEAIAAYERALALQPDSPEWQFELADLRGNTPRSAPDAYVKTLFDEYAFRFDRHLVDELRYSVPQNLLALVLGLRPQPQTLDILDLGCGTGLCGVLFRRHARSLTGVDLSPNMIACTRQRRDEAGRPVYDNLYTGHMLPALKQYDSQFDVILAADVFIYVGALDEIFPAAARALRPGGLLAFSLERHDGPEEFILHHRFAHQLSYIRKLAQESHFTELVAQSSMLRTDIPAGWLVVLQK